MRRQKRWKHRQNKASFGRHTEGSKFRQRNKRKLEKTASLNTAFDTSKKAWEAVQQRPKVTIPNDVFRYDKFPDYNTNNVNNHKNGIRIGWLDDSRHMLTTIPHGVRKITVSDDDANKMIGKLKELA